MKIRAASTALAALALAACGGGTQTSSIPSSGSTNSASAASSAATPAPSGCSSVEQPNPKPEGKLKKPTLKLNDAKTYTATVKTNCGTFAFTLDVKDAPHAAASLAYLAGKKFFDGTIFHRIAPGFVIQGGDPTGSGSGGPGYSTVDKPPAGTKYKFGAVAMAKGGTEPAGTAGSQFFVVTGPDAGLPPDYALVGQITRGADVVKRIGKLGDQSEQPIATVEIESLRVAPR